MLDGKRWVHRFETNVLDRDFAVGGLHGEFSLAQEAMSAVKFDPAKDRLFCVGDLLDRGAQPAQTAEFLRKPGVFSILGNHERDLVSIARGPSARAPKLLEIQSRENGHSWWFDLAPTLGEEIIRAIEELPLAIEIETHQGLVCLVRAEPAAKVSLGQFAQHLEDGAPDAIDCALWSREIAEDPVEHVG